MSSLFKIWRIGVLAALYFVFISTGCFDDNPQSLPIPDSTALDFDLQMMDTNTAPFKSFKSKNVFIFFASAGCGNCLAARSPAQSFADSLRPSGVISVLIFSFYSASYEIESFMSDSLIRMPAYFDTNGVWFSEYGERYTPLFLAHRASDGKWIRQTGYMPDSFESMKTAFTKHWDGE